MQSTSKERSALASVSLGKLAPCVVIVIARCRQAREVKATTSAAPVSAAPVVVKDVHVSDEFNGRVWATNYADIRPRVRDFIDRIAFRQGQMVNRGDLFFVIDPRPYRDAADSTNAN
jgi:membrane fusion protein, multidrug efflux system